MRPSALSRITKPGGEALAQSMGGEAASSVSSETDYLIDGEAAGSKLEVAQGLEVPVLDEDAVFEVDSGALPSSANAMASAAAWRASSNVS